MKSDSRQTRIVWRKCITCGADWPWSHRRPDSSQNARRCPLCRADRTGTQRSGVDPTPKQLAEATAAIRARWSDQEYRKRDAHRSITRVEIPEVRVHLSDA